MISGRSVLNCKLQVAVAHATGHYFDIKRCMYPDDGWTEDGQQVVGMTLLELVKISQQDIYGPLPRDLKHHQQQYHHQDFEVPTTQNIGATALAQRLFWGRKLITLLSKHCCLVDKNLLLGHYSKLQDKLFNFGGSKYISCAVPSVVKVYLLCCPFCCIDVTLCCTFVFQVNIQKCICLFCSDYSMRWCCLLGIVLVNKFTFENCCVTNHASRHKMRLNMAYQEETLQPCQPNVLLQYAKIFKKCCLLVALPINMHFR